MYLSQGAVDILDYVVIGISGSVFLICLIGALAVILLSRSRTNADSKEFNQIWRARVCMQGPRSFTAHLNTSIVLFAFVMSMPACAGQVVCSLFTTIFEMDYHGEWLLRILFTTYDVRQTQYCNLIQHPPPSGMPAPPDAPAPQPASTSPPAVDNLLTSAVEMQLAAGEMDDTAPSEPPPPPPPVDLIYGPNCGFCTFALFSTLISATLGTCMLLALLFVTQKVVVATINKTLIRRMRFLQIFTTIFIAGSLICRGVTVIYQPYQINFEILRVISVVCIAGTILTLSSILVYHPLWETMSAQRVYKKLQQQDEQNCTINPLLAVEASRRVSATSQKSGDREPIESSAEKLGKAVEV